jgi:protein-disulfide isomerase
MKKRILLLITSVIFTMFTIVSCASEATASDKKLDSQIDHYINSHPGLFNEMVIAAKKQNANTKPGQQAASHQSLSKEQVSFGKKVYSHLIAKPELLHKMFENYKAVKTGKVKITKEKVGTGVDKSIHDYLIANARPVLIGMSQAAEAKFAATKQKTLAKQFMAKIGSDNIAPAEGKANAKTTLVEYFDYQCSACKAEWPQLKTAIQKDKDLKVIFAEFPFFKGSEYAAKVSIAGYALDKNKFAKLHNGLMELNIPENALTPKDIMKVASKAGYQKSDLDNYINKNNKKINAELAQNRAWFDKLHFNGTPSIIIYNKENKKVVVIPGAPRYLQQTISQVSKVA